MSKARIEQLQQSLRDGIASFNGLAQRAYEKVVEHQRIDFYETTACNFAKATLKEVVSSAIGTFGPGAFIDGVYGGEGVAKGWSNLAKEGKNFTLELADNVNKALISEVAGQLQGELEDLVLGAIPEEKAQSVIDENLTGSASPIADARAALRELPVLKSTIQAVMTETGVHGMSFKHANAANGRSSFGFFKGSESTSSLIKETCHQVDQLATAYNALYELDKRIDTWMSPRSYITPHFRKCREMCEFVYAMYWFRRKYNKTKHFLNLLRDDYVAVGGTLSVMEKFWRDNIINYEMAAMRAAAIFKFDHGSGGTRVHLYSDLIEKGGGTEGTGNMTEGRRNHKQTK
jgi:hypothetical protein